MLLNAPFPDLRGEHRAEPVPPEPYRLVADIDTALEQQVLDLAQRQRVPDIHHHRQADDLGRTIEIAEWISHPTTLRTDPAPLKPICSDTAVKTLQKFASVHASIHNHFNVERHLNRRDEFKQDRAAALAEWRQLAA